jgi:serine/threonine protein phosphatase PrpC
VLEETCAKLIRAANEAGGRDNITCVLARAR